MDSAGIGLRVRTMREVVGLTQKQVAEKLGMQRTALVQVETGSRRLSASELMDLAKLFNVSVEQLLDPEQLPQVDLHEPVMRKEENGIRISVPSRNVAKFREVLLYILEKVGARPHVGETVIYKLLYFSDFDYYEKYEEHLTGAAYIRNNFGPTPASFSKIIDQMVKRGDLDKIQSDYFTYPQTKYLPRRSADLSVLSARELDTINEVLCRLGEMNATHISDYSHGDVPWKVTEPGKQIAYETVFYRLAPYSVRSYGED
jgi:transcriptional regulator with XRE-family HTH domain